MLGTGFAERKTSNDQSISILHRISVTQRGVSDCDKLYISNYILVTMLVAFVMLY